MASSTRQALAAGKVALKPLLATADLNFAAELFAIAEAIASSVQLSNILSDPSAENAAKQGALNAVFGKTAGKSAVEFVTSLVALRWSTGRDLVAGIEQLAVYAVASIAAADKSISTLETELFSVRQTIDSDQELQFALSSKTATDASKLALVDALIGKKVSKATNLLVRNAVLIARRERVSVVLEQFVKQVSAIATRLVATVTVAAPLDAKQLDRLGAALAKNYGQELQLNVELDPTLIGGVRVQVADEIIDGSLSSRLNEARLQLA
jgi:F-type H+-transporting ATPase subunit delta